MKILKGKSVFNGIAIGKLYSRQKEELSLKRYIVEDTEAEWARYLLARDTAVAQLSDLYEKALKEVGEAGAAIFEAHQMMLEDDDYNEAVEQIIKKERVNAEYAVAVTGNDFSEMFYQLDDNRSECAADVKDISERVIQNLMGSVLKEEYAEPVILVANDLAPSEIVQMDRSKILSFVTVQGSVNSHTAILARTMEIPALMSAEELKLDTEINGRMAIVDGYQGLLYLDPDETVLAQMQKLKDEEEHKREFLLTLKGKESITPDGQKMMLYANIGNVKELATVIQNDAEGIGLFRSEFIYLESSDYPSEEAQFGIYKRIAQTMAGKQVIIRTLDIGADKTCDYFHLEAEENPAMGCRAIRLCLTQPEIFKTQLRALFRASVYGNIAVMYPMITSLEEVFQIKEIVKEVQEELRVQGVDFAVPKQGIMIETPAAVMISRELAKEVDFFSIGTNDLTQYTLAIDRQNPKLDAFYNAHHPAILRMVQMVVENAHEQGIWVGICGELGADQELTKEFLKMGVDALSVSPGSILPIRKIIRETCVAGK